MGQESVPTLEIVIQGELLELMLPRFCKERLGGC